MKAVRRYYYTMIKVIAFTSLLLLYAMYSITVYTTGTRQQVVLSSKEEQHVAAGKLLFQKYNCTACHQIYGLGGYLGPELTTAWSDPARGEQYLRAFLQYGGPRMPDFHLQQHDIDNIVAYLKYVDATAVTYKKNNS